ncbi:hypothetical protein ACFWN7_05270 [Agromyces sp. NPDC058484]|uniref:hypothetical protein n=1 Tax=Agromyces sp. NPDC058484 TaxID=3346524 RepID=UPI0036495C0B
MTSTGANWLQKALFPIIAGVIILVFVGAWAAVLIQVWSFIPSEEAPAVVLGDGLVVAAGVLATTLGTQTASALGFAVAEVRAIKGDSGFSVVAVAQSLRIETYVAVFAYLAIGLAVFATWLFRESAAPELVNAFALSLLGWLIGASGVIFKPTGE